MTEILALKVSFISNEEAGHFVIGICLGLIEPFPNVGETFSVGEVIDEDDTDGAAVVAARDGLEGLLSGLHHPSCTVSHICNLTGLSPMLTIFDPNSTPMVVSWSNLNFFSRNCSSMQDLPTP